MAGDFSDSEVQVRYFKAYCLSRLGKMLFFYYLCKELCLYTHMETKMSIETRINRKGIDLSSSNAKLNVKSIDPSKNNLDKDPNPDMEGPQRHRGVTPRDVIANIVDKMDGFQVRFEADLMLLTKTEVLYLTPTMIQDKRQDLLEAAKLIQKRYDTIMEKTLKLDLVDEDSELVSAAGQANKQVWRFMHVYRYIG